MKRILLPLFLAVLFGSCEREIPPGLQTEEIEGYRIEGIVRDGFGRPMPSVTVTVEYSVEYVNSGPPPSQVYDVPNSNQFVRVRVYDGAGRFIRQLYSGTPPPGPLPANWDKRNAAGQLVRSGLYWVHFEVSNQSQMAFPVIVEKTITATTDSAGTFVLPDECLPMGFFPYAVYSADGSTFWGNYRIGDRVYLLLNASGALLSRSVVPERNRLTRIAITYN